MSSRDSQVSPAQPFMHAQTAWLLAGVSGSVASAVAAAHVPLWRHTTYAHGSESSQVFPVQPTGQSHAAVVLLQVPRLAHLKDGSSQTSLSLQVNPKYFGLVSEQSQVGFPENFLWLHLPPWRQYGAAAHGSSSSVHVSPFVPVLHVHVKESALEGSVPSTHVPPCLHGWDEQWSTLRLAQVAP